MSTRVSIIIPLFNQVAYTRLCMEYLIRNTPLEGVEVVLVDNASTDGTAEFVGTINGAVQKIRNTVNLGFAKACNQGARIARGEFLIFLNNDTAPHAGWLDGLLNPFTERPGLGMTGPKLIYPDNTIQQAGVVFEPSGLPYHIYMECAADLPCVNKARYFRALTGACFCLPRDLFLGLGGFDEAYVNGLEDIDLCLKVDRSRRGILYNPASVVTHFESRSEKRQAKMPDNVNYFRSVWGPGLERIDDHLYLIPDGMSIWYTADLSKKFLSVPAIEERLTEHVAKADKLIRKGDYKGAMEIYRAMTVQAPYNIGVLEKVRELTLKLGLKDVADQIRRRVAVLKEGLDGHGDSMITPPEPKPEAKVSAPA